MNEGGAMNQMETVKDHKVHGMPETLWRNARSLAALAGITVSQYVINALREAVEKNQKEDGNA